ncbi:glycine--tRNA ligase beta subunit [Paenibacillus baekrokdamisoli]|uniref:Glycine--tRNA ligase beta subunit n=1 Tax=Paenibacillus baekrokdamisoli TaxID=1712516 RepID=A0A3G9JE52_9BACL|nr:glycine--tRNA ligase subunit beta [Paenibacillus baekrokdamisoli]MBB3070264.1 glycyl-tRNA synthetase beta chain [Paenibacillus baekrokdamisoli]BBH21269.1 glycine--tRNA ligase beta subunit [Paenibacillus baekrokdamisoli]
MAKDLLLEIGLEEVPARFVRAAMNQLKEKTAKWLETARISHGEVKAFATPRRLTVLIQGVEEKQTDVSEEVKGPSRKIALDEQGAWSKAALGFARSQGVDPEQFYFKELAGVEYIYANKSSIGTETSEVLPEGLISIISSLSFPKNMRWGSYEFKFVRPIRWLVALFGSDVVPIEITNVKSGKTTRGHRFLGTETIVEEPAQYVEKLREQFVIVDVAEREQLILGQINALANEKKWEIAIKEDLLEEVVFLVEFPSVLFGTFDESFLNIPQEVLVTSMREHQRYFPVLGGDGKLLPFFVTVRNGDRVSIEQVAKGNEKVLRARLSDAKFFYAEDQKLEISTALKKLETIVYHEELGSVSDKVRRIEATASKIADTLNLDAQIAADVARTAAICKFDLVTQMVYEFPELQGIMGEDYARKAGEREAVAQAINEHYQPRFAGDRTPASIVGAVVSLADKIDTIVGCFSIGIIPTGSQDPYALRRQAAGIVQIVLAHNLKLPLDVLFDLSLAVHSEKAMKREVSDVRKDLYEFIALRVKNVLSEQGIRYDVIDAVMASGYNNLRLTVNRAAAVTAAAAGERKEEFKTVVDALNRVCNLASKAASKEVKPVLFIESAESELYAAWQTVSDDLTLAVNNNDPAAAIIKLTEIKDAINTFFDQVMVMAEDEAVRANRLALLAVLADGINKVADFSKLVW